LRADAKAGEFQFRLPASAGRQEHTASPAALGASPIDTCSPCSAKQGTRRRDQMLAVSAKHEHRGIRRRLRFVRSKTINDARPPDVS
jgi:hypothetical protein